MYLFGPTQLWSDESLTQVLISTLKKQLEPAAKLHQR